MTWPLRRFREEKRGVALTEFALALPVMLSVGVFGIELTHLGLSKLRASQIALSLADNASRVGINSNLATQQLREIDINDVLQAVRKQTGGMDILENGRITLSSLETNADGGQWVHWQRCIGKKSGAGFESTYGVAGDGATGTSFAGMGPAGSKVTAPPSSAVMFVELNYTYRPIMASWMMEPQKVHLVASFIVRDRRDLTQVFNPLPAATASTCDKHTT